MQLHSIDDINGMELAGGGFSGLGGLGAGAVKAASPAFNPGDLRMQLGRSQVIGPMLGALGGFLVQRSLVGVLVGAQVGDYIARKQIELEAPPPAPGTPVPTMLDTGMTGLGWLGSGHSGLGEFNSDTLWMILGGAVLFTMLTGGKKH